MVDSLDDILISNVSGTWLNMRDRLNASVSRNFTFDAVFHYLDSQTPTHHFGGFDSKYCSNKR
jgi:hypothetical protein